MHKRALEKMKNIIDEFCAIPDPSIEQSELFKNTMCGYKDFIEGEYKVNIIDEMKEAKEEERYGYRRSRDAMGRFTSRGRMGYRPYLAMDEDDYMQKYLDDPYQFKHNMNYGYRHDESMHNGMNNTNTDRMGYENSKYGRAYDDYRMHRRHYTETQNPEDHSKMKSKMSEIFDDMQDMANDIVKDMTPDEKAKYHQKLVEMTQKFQ